MEAFVYIWTDWVRDMLYIGVHKGPQDDRYICSSKPMLVEYRQRPGEFTRQIVAQGAWKDMLAFEQRLINASGAVKDPHYYNQAHAFGPYHCDNTGKTHSPETKAKMAASHLGKIKTPEHIAKLGAARLGRKHTPEACAKMAASHLGRTYAPLTPETRAKIGAAHLGKKLTLEHRQKMSLSQRKRWTLGRPATIPNQETPGNPLDHHRRSGGIIKNI